MLSLPDLPADFAKPVIIGIDPGSRVMGYGALVLHGKQPVLLAAGALGAADNRPAPGRLGGLRQDLDELFRKLRPATIVVERAFAGKNMASAIRMGEGRGVVLSSAALSGAEIREFTPAEIKKAVVGNGQAQKSQVAAMVVTALGEQAEGLGHDATDALAVALTWVYRRGFETVKQHSRRSR